MSDAIPGYHPIRTPGVVCHLLVDEAGATLIDTGLIGMPGLVEKRLAALGLGMAALKHIVLTHGHLDHTGGLHTLKRRSGATVHAHPDEQAHIDGAYPYRGVARLCGWLEALGRRCIGYRPVTIDKPFADGDLLALWGGLRVVHLPGHTAGHCGLYSERHDVLFCGDLVATTVGRAHRPPVFLNSCPAHFPASLRRAASLNARHVVPNHHAVWQSPEDVRRHLDRDLQRLGLGLGQDQGRARE